MPFEFHAIACISRRTLPYEQTDKISMGAHHQTISKATLSI